MPSKGSWTYLATRSSNTPKLCDCKSPRQYYWAGLQFFPFYQLGVICWVTPGDFLLSRDSWLEGSTEPFRVKVLGKWTPKWWIMQKMGPSDIRSIHWWDSFSLVSFCHDECILKDPRTTCWLMGIPAHYKPHSPTETTWHHCCFSFQVGKNGNFTLFWNIHICSFDFNQEKKSDPHIEQRILQSGLMFLRVDLGSTFSCSLCLYSLPVSISHGGPYPVIPIIWIMCPLMSLALSSWFTELQVYTTH